MAARDADRRPDREREGREHWPDMNYPDMNYPVYGNYGDTEARFRDRKGREHYDNGRYAPKMEEPEAEYPRPLVPPVYRELPMNRIGFVAPMDATHRNVNEMEHRTGHAEAGGAHSETTELTEDMAHEWMAGLVNEDGTKGAHWTMEQTTQVMKQKGIDCDPLEFWVAMNAVYSDYCGVAKKMNVNNIDFYSHMAKAFLFDKDSQPNRLARYYLYVTKH